MRSNLKPNLHIDPLLTTASLKKNVYMQSSDFDRDHFIPHNSKIQNYVQSSLVQNAFDVCSG